VLGRCDDGDGPGELADSDDEEEPPPGPVHDLGNDEDDVDPMECIICNNGRGLFGYDEERIQSASPDVRGLRPGVQGALAAPADDGGTGRNTNPASDALIGKLDLKCLEIEEGVNELLNVNMPRTLEVALDSGAGDHVAAADQVERSRSDHQLAGGTVATSSRLTATGWPTKARMS